MEIKHLEHQLKAEEKIEKFQDMKNITKVLFSIEI